MKKGKPDPFDMEIPEPVRIELEEQGGLAALTRRIPSQDELAVQSKIHHALSDPIRLTILYLLKDQPLCVCIIMRFLNLSGSKLSYHLTILKESGLIEGVYHGNWIIYSLKKRGRKYLK